MIKQNDRRCLPEMQEIGCFVRAAGAMAELVSHHYFEGKELTVEQVNELWTWAKKSGNVDYKNEVKHSAPIATKALQMLDLKGRFIEVATFNNGRMNYYASVTDDMKCLPKYYIQKINQNGPNKTHFRNINCFGELLFDPHEPAVCPQGVYYSIVYVYQE